MNLDTGVREMA